MTNNHGFLKKLVCWLFFLFPTLFVSKLVSEQINHLIATVGNIAVTHIDLQDEIKSLRKIKGAVPRGRSISHAAVDTLIDKAIIRHTAEEESISVSEKRVDNEIAKEIKFRGLRNKNELRKLLASYRTSYTAYRKSIAERIMTQQVASAKVKPSPPSEQEMKKFYNRQGAKLGFKYKCRIIVIPFKLGNLEDERRVNQLMNQAKKIARSSFAKAAAKYSRHSSRKNGGLIGWQRLDEIAQINPQLPNLIERTPVGKVSEEYPLGNKYYLVKVESRRKGSFDELRPRIGNMIYLQKQQERFKQWLVKERDRLSVKVFLKGYRAP